MTTALRFAVLDAVMHLDSARSVPSPEAAQVWLAPPWQSQMISWLPSVVSLPGMSTQRPLATPVIGPALGPVAGLKVIVVGWSTGSAPVVTVRVLVAAS